jgi:hypothetical protein
LVDVFTVVSLVKELLEAAGLFVKHRDIYFGLSLEYAERIVNEDWLTVLRAPDKRDMKNVKSVYRQRLESQSFTTSYASLLTAPSSRGTLKASHLSPNAGGRGSAAKHANLGQ